MKNFENIESKINQKIFKIKEIKDKVNYDSLINELHDINKKITDLEAKYNLLFKENIIPKNELFEIKKEISKNVNLKKSKQKNFNTLNKLQKDLFRLLNSNENIIIKNESLINFLTIEIQKSKVRLDKYLNLEILSKQNLDLKISETLENLKSFKNQKSKNLIDKYNLNKKIKFEKGNLKTFDKAKNFDNKDNLKLKKFKEDFDYKNKYFENLKDKNNKYKNLNILIENTLNKEKVLSNNNLIFEIKNLDAFYGQKQALYNVNLKIPKNKIISIIGPSGCGKTTFIKTLNRINDLNDNFSTNGKIIFDNEYDIYKLKSINNYYKKIELTELRTRIGMIFQQPNPFPISIYKNVVFSLKMSGIKNKNILKVLSKDALTNVGLWDEVKDNLDILGTSLSGGQQQRLCIARAIIQDPDVLLMDEPTSALDPISADIIEKLILRLKEKYTIIIVTHSMQQAQRISDYTAFFYQGELIEFDETKKLFKSPKNEQTKNYILGKFG